jgi:Ca-activated chloride channel family protein
MFVLLPLPLLFLIGRREHTASAIYAPLAQRWQRYTAQQTTRGFWRNMPFFSLLCWALLISALARPQWIGEPIELPNNGRDLMLALDLSGSMQIEDMVIGNRVIARITAVKAIASEFVERRQGDRLGLILFGTRAYLQAPLTFDTQTVSQFVRDAQLGFAGEDTAIGDALGLAVKRLRERPADARVLILLTDGQDTASTVDPMEAAALAAELGVKVYTIGISRQAGGTGATRRNGVDEALLLAIAEATGGRYFRARDPAELQSIYALIDQFEPIEQASSTFRPIRALGFVPMLVLLGLFALRSLWNAWPSQGHASGDRLNSSNTPIGGRAP